jgi:subfamily B ATP-binding cassette protein MsbA
LDEATSALDNKSEAIVQQAIDNLMIDRTVFIIAHRLSTVRNANKIVVVNYGKIAEIGSHEELLNKENSIYASLYRTQLH